MRTEPVAAIRPRLALTTFALFLAVALSLVGLNLTLAAPAHAAELVKNYHFGQGTDGWRTNGSAQRLQVIDIDGGRAARLTTSTTTHAVLNDEVNTVRSTGAPGASYAVKARVRTTTPGVKGALRFREVASSRVVPHQSSFSLDNTSWKMVSLQVTTTTTDATMDLNVVAWDLSSSDNLIIDLVSVEPSSSTVSEPAPAPAPAPAPISSCEGRVPTKSLFGANISGSRTSNEESLRQIDEAFGKVPVVRTFDPYLPQMWDKLRSQLTKDRTLVTSFRPKPQEVLSGKHDEFFRNWFKSAPDNQQIYWSYIHEPEPLIRDGNFTAQQYKDAWRRLARFADEACKPNMHATLILTGWTAMPASNRDYRTYDAGYDTIDVLAWGPYNGATDPDRDYYDDVSNFMAPAVEVSKADGRPWGIAETGSRLIPGDAGQGRAAWLRSVGNYAINNGAQFVTYFHSTRDGDWRLNDSYSRAVWRDFVAR